HLRIRNQPVRAAETNPGDVVDVSAEVDPFGQHHQPYRVPFAATARHRPAVGGGTVPVSHPQGWSQDTAQAAAPARWSATDEGSGAEDADPKAEEAELGQSEMCPGAAVERQRGHRVCTPRGPHTARAQCGAGAQET